MESPASVHHQPREGGHTNWSLPENFKKLECAVNGWLDGSAQQNGFEALVIPDEYEWPVWVSDNSLVVTQPVKVVYRRLHHRSNVVKAYSKKVQETLSIKFHQIVINSKVLALAMLEAKLFNSL